MKQTFYKRPCTVHHYNGRNTEAKWKVHFILFYFALFCCNYLVLNIILILISFYQIMFSTTNIKLLFLMCSWSYFRCQHNLFSVNILHYFISINIHIVQYIAKHNRLCKKSELFSFILFPLIVCLMFLCKAHWIYHFAWNIIL